VEDKRLDDGGIAVVLAAVDDDRGSRAVVLASLFVRVDVMDRHERRHLDARHLHRNLLENRPHDRRHLDARHLYFKARAS